MMPFTESSLPPVEDSRTVMNERINPDDNTERRVKSDEDIQPALTTTTTTKPDFAVSKDEPQSSSFDVVDHNGNAQAEEKKHARNLSAHFFEATRLTDDAAENPNDTLKADGYHLGTENNNNKGLVFRSPSKNISSSGQPPPPSPAANVGQKHRRGFSGDVSNPVVAHRRINSIGNSAAVERAQGYYSKNYSSSKHRREDSAGLDILSAAVDASAEDLDMAVGSGRKGPWEPPADSRYTTRPPHEAGPRSSPSTVSVTSTSYEYPRHRSYPPPPTQTYHAPGAPPPPPPNHTYGPYPPPAFYPPGGPPPPYYAYPVPPYSTPAPRGHDPYKRVYVVDHPVVTQSSSMESAGRSSERLETDEKLFDRKKPMQPPNWHGRGSAPFPAPEETSRPQRSTTESVPPPSGGPGHHRKMSSYSSLGNLMSSALFPDPEQPSSGGHHRSTSSTTSFLNGLEDAGDLFLQNLGAPGAPPPQPPQSTTTATMAVPALPNSKAAAPRKTEPSPPPRSSSAGRLAQGGASKRIRRKCTVDGCPNRVVQGGLCISHGAKRKTCKYPGCTKNVKKAGLCSTHGPARKRCEADGCTKVAVQGGKCIAHGAKKKLCLMDGCTKQAILTGMCKKHHDQSLGIVSARGGGGKRVADAPVCVVIDKRGDEPKKASGHTRGLSIFQEISPDAVGNLLETDGGAGGGGGETHPLRRDGDRSTGERGGYRNYY